MQDNRFPGKKSLDRQVRLNHLPAEPVKDKGADLDERLRSP
ncbi:hypothetical protein [Nocardia paucivorans]|nr:hypothetical protein [Nocardia paucivorans]